MTIRALVFSFVFCFACQALLFAAGFFIAVRNFILARSFKRHLPATLFYTPLISSFNSCWWMFKKPSPSLVSLMHGVRFAEGGNEYISVQLIRLLRSFALLISVMQVMVGNFILMGLILMAMCGSHPKRVLLLALLEVWFLSFAIVCRRAHRGVITFKEMLECHGHVERMPDPKTGRAGRKWTSSRPPLVK